MPFSRGIDVVDHLNYDEWVDLGGMERLPGFTKTDEAVLYEQLELGQATSKWWLPKSTLCIFNKRLWLAKWKADEEGIE